MMLVSALILSFKDSYLDFIGSLTSLTKKNMMQYVNVIVLHFVCFCVLFYYNSFPELPSFSG